MSRIRQDDEWCDGIGSEDPSEVGMTIAWVRRRMAHSNLTLKSCPETISSALSYVLLTVRTDQSVPKRTGYSQTSQIKR